MNFFTHYSNIDHILNDLEFNDELDNLLKEFNEKNISCPTVRQGKIITTCSDSTAVFNLKKQNLIIEWLQKTLDEYFLLRNIKDYNYRIRRQWCNFNFYRSEVKPHNHTAIQDSLVVVLYYKIPTNCSKYVLIHSDIEKESYKDYSLDEISFIDVSNGLAICHDPKYFHAVTEQKSHDTRIVFVFDIEYKIKK